MEPTDNKKRTTVIFKGVSKNIAELIIDNEVSLTTVISTLLHDALMNGRLVDLAKQDLGIEEYISFVHKAEELKNKLKQ